MRIRTCMMNRCGACFCFSFVLLYKEIHIEKIEEALPYPAICITLLPSLLYPDRIYFIGGTPLDKQDYNQYSSYFYLYNLETMDCQRLEDLPFNIRSGKGLTNLKTQQLCVISFDTLNRNKKDQSIYILNESKMKWTRISFEGILAEKRDNFSHGNYEVATEAAFDEQGQLHVIFSGRYHRVYNFDRKEWIAKADLPSIASVNGGLVNLNNGKNQLYHFGGGSGGESFIYDYGKDEWIENGYLPSLWKNFSYVENGKQMFVFGHWYSIRDVRLGNAHGDSKRIYMFDFVTFKWTKLHYELGDNASVGCCVGCSSALINNRILILGGGFEVLSFYDGLEQADNFVMTFETTTSTTQKTTTAPKTTTLTMVKQDKELAESNSRTNRTNNLCSKKTFILIAQILKYKSIYVSVIIHFSDVITDYLVLIQYIFYYYYQYGSNDNVDYFFVSLFCFLTIFLNKVLSSYYIWQFTQNAFDVILNIGDFYILKEVLASHETGNQTDLLMYLQKIERIFESSWQFVIQTYVFLRTNDTNSSDITFSYIVQISSIFLSLYAISNKLISDDKFIFIEKSGANKKWTPHPKFAFRVLFRLSEVIPNLLSIIIVSVFYGVYLAFIYLLYLLSINLMLFRNGLLGTNKSNILGNVVAVINLGVTARHNNNVKEINYISQISRYTAVCLFKRSLCLCNKIMNVEQYGHSLSFYLVVTRIISGLWVMSITIILYYTTKNVNFGSVLTIIPDEETRYVRSSLVQFLSWFVILCYILQIILYRLIFSSMHLGVSLQRDLTAYVLNYKFCDAIRLEKIKKQQTTNVKIVRKILTTIVTENVPLLGATKIQIKKKKDARKITREQSNEHLYLINRINTLIVTQYDDIQQMLCDILSYAIFNCHLTMMQFIIGNKWIDNICTIKFMQNELYLTENDRREQTKGENILSFIIKHCSHRGDIMASILIEYDDCFDGKLHVLLGCESGSGIYTNYNTKQLVIHQLLANTRTTPEIVKHLSDKYYEIFFKCNVLKYIFMYEMNWFINSIRLPFLPDYCIDKMDLGTYNMTPIRANMLINLLHNCKCKLSLYKLYQEDRTHAIQVRGFRYELLSNYLSSIINYQDDNNGEFENDITKLRKYLDCVPDLNQSMFVPEFNIRCKYNVLRAFIYWYSTNPGNDDRILKLLKYILTNYEWDINQEEKAHIRTSFTLNTVIFCLLKLDMKAMRLFFKSKASQINWNFKIKQERIEYSMSEWIKQDSVQTVCPKDWILESLAHCGSTDKQH